MNDKAQILQAVRKARPALLPLPNLPTGKVSATALRSRFTESLLQVGSEWITETDLGSWSTYLQKYYPESKRVVTTNPILAEQEELEFLAPGQAEGHELINVDVAIIDGQWAVAENGAIWVSEENLPARVLPFITQHLIVMVSIEMLVATMHDAYTRISLAASGYGVFIAGPSKTADIEQSLVKGAQGARTELVVIRET